MADSGGASRSPTRRPQSSRNRRRQGRQVEALDALSETANLFAIPHRGFPLKDEDKEENYAQSRMEFLKQSLLSARNHEGDPVPGHFGRHQKRMQIFSRL
jgi:hypothetical protein